MKISSSIRFLYADLYDVAKELEQYVLENISDFCDANSYTYHSRIKTEESFAEKLETGWHEMHDFLGLTIVVPKYSHISRVKRFLSSSFKLIHQRPEHPKKPQDFDFDTPRYYYRCKKLLSLRDKRFSNFIFEIQITTMLEDCWSKLFHDYSYKSDDINWGKERISFQIKALLKNADMIVHEADKLSTSKILRDSCDRYTNLNKIKLFLQKHWPPHCLATNLKRECETIATILRVSELKIEDLDAIIAKHTSLGRGAKLLNLSPYGAVIQTLFDENHSVFKRYVQKKIDNTKTRPTILIVDEIEIPNDVLLKNDTYGQKIECYKNCTHCVATKLSKTKSKK